MDHNSPPLGWLQDNDSSFRALNDSTSRCLLYFKIDDLFVMLSVLQNSFISAHMKLENLVVQCFTFIPLRNLACEY